MPLRETAFQGYTFLALVYAGFGAGALCGLLFPLLNSRRWYLRLTGDLMLCSAAAALVLAALAATGAGGLRLYMALAAALGAAIYHYGVGRLLRWLIKLPWKNRTFPKAGE